MNSSKICKPFIKKFKDGDFFYIYDVNTNQVIEVEAPTYDLIDNSDGNGNYSQPARQQAIKQIEQAKSDFGLFSSFRPKKVTLGIKNADGVKDLHKKGLQQLILELTRECNLNCSYCRTSGKYFTTSNDSCLEMNWSHCQKAIDFFCERAGDSQPPAITFYGGEPLLKFDRIREVVAYVRERHGEKNCAFNLTTNGALLDKEKIDFFIRHDFRVTVSLDGPKNVHDRYRLFKDGSGTFDTIMENLAYIKDYNCEYYGSRFTISCVFSPPFDQVDELLDFFSNHPTLIDIKHTINFNSVDTSGTNFIEDFSLEDSDGHFGDITDKFNSRLKQAILGHDLNRLTVEKKKVFSILHNLARRPIKQLYDFVHPLGACHIALRRLFVDVSGNYNICEKAGEEYKIGHIDTGFDYEQIAAYYRKFQKALEDCKNCWAISHCERCWVSIGNLDEFTGEVKEEFCNMNRTIIEKAFKMYTQLLREDPDCLKVFSDVIVA